jgi:hypothetical protein
MPTTSRRRSVAKSAHERRATLNFGAAAAHERSNLHEYDARNGVASAEK